MIKYNKEQEKVKSTIIEQLNTLEEHRLKTDEEARAKATSINGFSKVKLKLKKNYKIFE